MFPPVQVAVHSCADGWVHSCVGGFANFCVGAYVHTCEGGYVHSCVGGFVVSCVGGCVYSSVGDYVQSCVGGCVHSCVGGYVHSCAGGCVTEGGMTGENLAWPGKVGGPVMPILESCSVITPCGHYAQYSLVICPGHPCTVATKEFHGRTPVWSLTKLRLLTCTIVHGLTM